MSGARFAAGLGGGLVAAAFVGLGLLRLEVEHQQPALTEADVAGVQNCLPLVELPADGLVFVSEPAVAGAAAAPPAPGSAPLKFDALVTAPIKLDKSDGDGSNQKPIFIRRAQAGASTLELRPLDAKELVVQRDGAVYVLDITRQAAVRFGAAPQTSYKFEAAQQASVITSVADGRTLAAGSEGLVSVSGAVPLQTLHPLFVGRTVQPMEAQLHPIRVSGQPGLSSVSVEVRQAGSTGKTTTFSACAWSEKSRAWYPAVVAEHGSLSEGGSKLLISLPPSTFPQGNDWAQPVVVALASADGRFLAIGRFQAVSRLVAGVVATAVLALLLVVVMVARARQFPGDDPAGRPWLSGLFTGPDGDPSLSLWQMFVWTIVTVWGMFYVFIVAGSLLVLTPEVLGLVGIAGSGSVVARFIAGSAGSTSRRAGGDTGAHPFLQMLSTNNQFDLLKLQLFVFTAIVAIYVVSRIADAAAFPALDANTLLLMGVSQGVYITSKAASSTGIAKAVALKAEIGLNAEQQKNLDARLVITRQGQKLADEAAAAVVGAPIPEDLRKQQQDTAREVADLEKLQKTAIDRGAALKLDFDKAIRELGLAD